MQSDNNNQENEQAETPKTPRNPKLLEKKVKQAIAWRSSAKYDESWSKMIKMYSNQYDYPELAMYEDVVAPNMVFSTVNVIVPSIAINYPKITVTPRKPEGEIPATIVESVANYYWRHFDVHDEFRLVIKDFVILGHGWLKTTWAFEEEQQDVPPDEWKQMVQQALLQRNMAQAQAQQAGVTGITFPTDQEVVASIPQKKTVVIEDNPAVERVSPFDIFVDPTATRLKNARWIAQRIFMPLEQAQLNADWDAKARKELTGTAMLREKVDVAKEGEEKPRDKDFATIWEFYDLISGESCVFAEGASLFLAKPEKSQFRNKHPYVMVSNYQVPERLYPIGDIETAAPLQQELAITRTQMINDRKRFRRMYLYRPDAIGEDGVNSLLSSDDNAMIEVEGDRPFSDVLAPVGTMALPPEFYNQTNMILQDINLVSGVSEYQRGAVSEIRRTATEASMIQDAANARAADKLSIVERSIGEVAQRVVQLAQENLTSEQVAKIVDEQGAIQWVPYTAESIMGEFDFEVEAGSTQPQNETTRRQSAMQLMDAMAPFIQMGVIDPRQMAEHLMKNGFGIKNPERFMTAPPPPMGMPGQPGAPGEQPGEPTDNPNQEQPGEPADPGMSGPPQGMPPGM